MRYVSLIGRWLRAPRRYVLIFLKWTLLAILVGAVSGVFGGAFHELLELAGELRLRHAWLLWLLPLGGLFIVLLYRLLRMQNDRGINTVMTAVRGGRGVRLATAPLIFIATAVTHLFGGSAGREGAALQIGAGIGSESARLLRLRHPSDMRIMLLCGMSGTFAALFGTPLTAAFFSVEFISVGVMYYSGIYSCIVSAIAAIGVTRLFGISHTVYLLPELPTPGPLTMLAVIGLALIVAVVGILFCVALHGAEHLARRFLPNAFLRIALGGLLLIALTLLFGRAYNGASVPLLEAALGGEAPPAAFLLKMLFTVVTVAVGYRGGEIVPTFCIGASLGVLVAPLLGLAPAFAAALGLVGLFSAVTNAPIASVLLAYELFGGESLICFATVSIVCFLFSGNFSLYADQKFVFSKSIEDFDPAAVSVFAAESEESEERGGSDHET
jgi:H+/Cl- antiporter ClcA